MKSWNSALQLLLGQGVSHLRDPLAQGVAAGVLAQHQVGPRHADVLGPHDLVGRTLLEHPVLVDARLVGEGIAADDRLVALDGQAGDRREHPADRVEPLGLDLGRQAVVVEPGLQCHDDLFERGVAGALADAVDRAFDLPGAGLAAGQAVGDGHAEVVVAMGADDRPADIGNAFLERADHPGVLERRRIADGVRDVDRGGAGLDGRLDDLAEEVELGPRGVLGAELDVRTARLGPPDALDRLLDDLRLGHPQLVLAVDRRGGQEDVDSRLWANWIASQARSMSRSLQRARPQTDEPATSVAIARTASKSPTEAIGKPGLDDVDPQRGQRAGHLELLGHVHARARRLLAVAQRGVEDPHPVRLGWRYGRSNSAAWTCSWFGSFLFFGRDQLGFQIPRFRSRCRPARRWNNRGPKHTKPRDPPVGRVSGLRWLRSLRTRRTLRPPPRPPDKAKAEVRLSRRIADKIRTEELQSEFEHNHLSES